VAVEDLRQRWVAVHPLTYPPSGLPSLEGGGVGGIGPGRCPAGVGRVPTHHPRSLPEFKVWLHCVVFFDPRWWLGGGDWER